MYFTPYVPILGTSSSVDPLGFLQPSAALADLLFKQFTVLSHHPAYHGFLCFVLNYLDETGYGSGVDLATNIRDMEIFWGMLSLRTNGESILNVTKYRRLPADGLTLAKARKNRSLYERLSYGTLGHYTGPSVRWALLEEGGRRLTQDGRDLGEAWGSRGKTPFATLLKKWLADKNVLDSPLEDLSPYCVSGEPSEKEQAVWQRIIKTCQEVPISGALWEEPLKSETLDLAEKEETYHRFFPAVREHYSRHEQLQQRLSLCQHFEEICALVQCVFDWAYRRKSLVDNVGAQASPPEESVLLALKESIKKFHSVSSLDKPPWKLPGRLESCSSYSALEDSIILHHCEHQRRKGAAPFMDTEKILMSGRVDEGRIATLVEKFNGSPERITPLAAWVYRRGWYFWNAYRWLQYAGRISDDRA